VANYGNWASRMAIAAAVVSRGVGITENTVGSCGGASPWRARRLRAVAVPHALRPGVLAWESD
jgi:hypothetical protein